MLPLRTGRGRSFTRGPGPGGAKGQTRARGQGLAEPSTPLATPSGAGPNPDSGAGQGPNRPLLSSPDRPAPRPCRPNLIPWPGVLSLLRPTPPWPDAEVLQDPAPLNPSETQDRSEPWERPADPCDSQ